ncbi:UNVERIFIED_CONTAM: hypothetical protein Sradi_6376700 [Sesamum radiatum]|uniref:Uncharacterized protein n=1 Tax=Sesamum radiatum TaxID=300843 RepID=A0AAW2K368_SESRA
MASACVNNIGMPPENFLDCPSVKCPSYGWLSPRISSSREFPKEETSKASSTKASAKNQAESDNVDVEKQEDSDPEISGKDFVDFEFRLEDPVTMLPADELFFDGKLVPLHLSTIRQSMISVPALSDVRSPDDPNFRRRCEISSTDPYLFSPKAPRCSSGWKELLGLKKLYQNSNAKQEDQKTASALSSHNRNAARSLKNFLHRGSKSALNASVDSSLSLPLLKETDNESVSVSSRLSLSSSSSGYEYNDLPRLSLDSDKPSSVPRNTHQVTSNLSKVRVVKHKAALSSENSTASTRVGRSPMRRTPESTVPARDFRYKHRGVERSYSANVRITPVLNVPVCSLRGSSKSGVFGFPLFSSQQKKDSGSNVGANKSQQRHNKNRADRT